MVLALNILTLFPGQALHLVTECILREETGLFGVKPIAGCIHLAEAVEVMDFLLPHFRALYIILYYVMMAIMIIFQHSGLTYITHGMEPALKI